MSASNSKPKGAARAYRDYVLLAPPADSTEWKHNLMKFVAPGQSKLVDPRAFLQPLSLSRKDERALTAQEVAAVAAAEAKPEDSLTAPDDPAAAAASAATTDKPKKGWGQNRKTKQVYQNAASAVARRIQAEERHPWLLEDASPGPSKGHQRWTGKVEGTTGDMGGLDDGASGGTSKSKGNSYVLFLLNTDATSATMQVMPARRTYRFTPRPLMRTIETDDSADPVSFRSIHYYQPLFLSYSYRLPSMPKPKLKTVGRTAERRWRKRPLSKPCKMSKAPSSSRTAPASS